MAHPSGFSAPRTTRVASVVVMIGVLAQASIAGGFLAGHTSLTDVHMIVGVPLMVSALALVGVGIAHRRTDSEPPGVLLTRVGVLAGLLLTAVVGILAGQGTRDLLVAHIPLAIVSMGLAARLAIAAGQHMRATAGPPSPPLEGQSRNRDEPGELISVMSVALQVLGAACRGGAA